MNSKKYYNERSYLERKSTFIFLCFGIFFYSAFFFFAYFAPLYFPSIFSSNIFKNLAMGEVDKYPILLHIQLGLYLFIEVNLLISLIKTTTTKLNTIPDSEPWQLNIDPKLSPQERIETEALKIIHLEEKLRKNGNKLLIKKDKEKEIENANFDDSSTNSGTYSSPSMSISIKDYISINQRQILNGKEELRYCSVCNKLQPDRCHHCKYCNTCHLRMDHHCFWLDCCIAFENHKFFFLTLFYANSLILFFDIIFVRVLINMNNNQYYDNKSFISLIFIVIILNSFGTFTMMLMFYHICLIFYNYTNMEYNKLVKGSSKNENFYFDIDEFVDKNEKYFNDVPMFDIGLIRNIKQIFGNNILFWLLPVNNENDGSYNSIGLCYDINKAYDIENIGYI